MGRAIAGSPDVGQALRRRLAFFVALVAVFFRRPYVEPLIDWLLLISSKTSWRFS